MAPHPFAVPGTGLEPVRPKTTHFECAASTNSANPALCPLQGTPYRITNDVALA